MTVGISLGAARVGRDGALRLRFDRRGPATVVAGCRYTLPLQVLAPVALDDPAAVVSMLNPTGGLVGGDRLSIDVDVAAGAHAVLTTPSATRVYRTEGEETIQSMRLAIGPHAVVEWVDPQAHLPFLIGAGAVLVAAFVLATVRKSLAAADRGEIAQPEIDELDEVENQHPVIGRVSHVLLLKAQTDPPSSLIGTTYLDTLLTASGGGGGGGEGGPPGGAPWCEPHSSRCRS